MRSRQFLTENGGDLGMLTRLADGSCRDVRVVMG